MLLVRLKKLHKSQVIKKNASHFHKDAFSNLKPIPKTISLMKCVLHII